MLDRRKFERGLKKIRFSKRKIGIGFENRRKDCELGYKFKLCQFESSLPRQTAKNRLCTAILVEISSSTMRETGPPFVHPSPFILLFLCFCPPSGKSHGRNVSFSSTNENRPTFLSKGNPRRWAEGTREPHVSSGNTDFSIVSFSGHDRCVDAQRVRF